MFFLLQSMRQHMMNFVLGGLTKTYTVSDLIVGTTTTLNQRINTGSLLQGNLYVDDLVTPIIPWWQGPASGHSYTIMTGEGVNDPTSKVGSIYWQDGDNYIWLTNNLWTEAGWTSVKWFNEANGNSPQYLAIPGYESYTNFGFRLDNQNTQSMNAITVPHGIESTSLSQYLAVVNPLSYDSYYQKVDDFGNVTQQLWSAQYTDQANPGNMYRDMATYQMPVTIGQNLSKYLNWDSYTATTYDLQSGYALENYNFRTHAMWIEPNTYFSYYMMDIANTTGEVLSTFNHTTAVDIDTFTTLMYPANGTVTYKAGVKQEDTTKEEVNLAAIIPILISVGIALVVACCFICQYYKAD